MKIDFKSKLLSLGNEIKEDEGNKVFTLGSACILALLRAPTDEGEVKFKRAKLAERIHVAHQYLDITPEESTVLKEVIGRVFAPHVVGASWDILNG
jgi:hypothetical protein